jgi:hypothetical protein
MRKAILIWLAMVAVASADPWAAQLGEWVALQQRRAVVSPYPENNALYNAAFGWWVFDSNVNPQPDSKGDADLIVFGADWSDGAYTFNSAGSKYLYNFTNDYNSASTNGAINFWVNPNPGTTATVLSAGIMFRNNTTTSKHLNIRYYGPSASASLRNKMYISINNAASFMYSTAVVTTNQWQMMTVVSDGSSYIWYRNGVQLASDLNGGAQGVWFNGVIDRNIVLFGFGFPGSLGDVAVFNGTITSNQVYQLYLDTKATYE